MEPNFQEMLREQEKLNARLVRAGRIEDRPGVSETGSDIIVVVSPGSHRFHAEPEGLCHFAGAEADIPNDRLETAPSLQVAGSAKVVLHHPQDMKAVVRHFILLKKRA